VNPPQVKEGSSAEALREAVLAAGRTKVICAGGKETSAEEFLTRLHEQIHVGRAAGNATGRNIHQRPLEEAVRFCNAISAITLDDASVDEAMGCTRGRISRGDLEPIRKLLPHPSPGAEIGPGTGLRAGFRIGT
jgi:hypothetical protein